MTLCYISDLLKIYYRKLLCLLVLIAGLFSSSVYTRLNLWPSRGQHMRMVFSGLCNGCDYDPYFGFIGRACMQFILWFLISRMTTVQPGPVSTKFAENAQAGNIDAVAEDIDESSRNAIKNFKDSFLSTFKQICQQGEDIANVILEAITSSSPHARYMTHPKYAEMLKARYSDLTGDNLMKLALEAFCQAKKT